jgi:hypothetical protein
MFYISADGKYAIPVDAIDPADINTVDIETLPKIRLK